MASFTNKPSVFTYSVDMDFAASFMEIDSLSALLTPFTQRLRRDGQAQQQQQQQWGILGRMLLQCSSWCECSDHGVVSLCSEERVKLWACTWLRWHDAADVLAPLWSCHFCSVLNYTSTVGRAGPPTHGRVAQSTIGLLRCRRAPCFAFLLCCRARKQTTATLSKAGERAHGAHEWLTAAAVSPPALLYIFSLLL